MPGRSIEPKDETCAGVAQQEHTFYRLWCGTGAMGLCHTTIYIPGAAPPRDIPEKL